VFNLTSGECIDLLILSINDLNIMAPVEDANECAP
jgi:hypothetical protein